MILLTLISDRVGALLSDNQPGRFEYDAALERTKKQFAGELREGAEEDRELICAVGALLGYISEMQRSDLPYIRELEIYTGGQYLETDVNTRRNLELTETLRSKEKKGSLLWVIDKTETAPGARMLRSWLEHPLRTPSLIVRRQGAIGFFEKLILLPRETGNLLFLMCWT